MTDKNTPDAISCFDCQNRPRTEWSVLDREQIARLEKTRGCRRFGPGDTVYFEGDPCDGVFCVETGLIGVRKSDSDGNSVLLRLAGPGDTLGYRAFLAGQDHRTSAEALGKTTLCYIPQASLRALLADAPTLGLRFLQHAATDLDATETKLLQSSAQSARIRLIHALLVMRDQMGVPTDKGGMLTFTLPVSRQDLAAMIGARPETLSRTIKQMEKDGAALFEGRDVRIPSLDSLLDEII